MPCRLSHDEPISTGPNLGTLRKSEDYPTLTPWTDNSISYSRCPPRKALPRKHVRHRRSRHVMPMNTRKITIEIHLTNFEAVRDRNDSWTGAPRTTHSGNVLVSNTTLGPLITDDLEQRANANHWGAWGASCLLTGLIGQLACYRTRGGAPVRTTDNTEGCANNRLLTARHTV